MPNRLGLALAAKKLRIGTTLSLKAIRSGTAKIVLLANDASKGTIKNITDKAKFYNVPVILKFDTYELSKPIGRKNIKVISILDEGFAEMYK